MYRTDPRTFRLSTCPRRASAFRSAFSLSEYAPWKHARVPQCAISPPIQRAALRARQTGSLPGELRRDTRPSTHYGNARGKSHGQRERRWDRIRRPQRGRHTQPDQEQRQEPEDQEEPEEPPKLHPTRAPACPLPKFLLDLPQFTPLFSRATNHKVPDHQEPIPNTPYEAPSRHPVEHRSR